MRSDTSGDLISRSALIAEHCDGCDALAHGLCNHDVCGAALLILEAPAVDAVKVTRCRDCKHWKHFDHLGCTDFVKVCGLANYMIGATGYCLYAERRAEDGK